MTNKPKKAILIQARLSSTRFPSKMLEPLGGIPLFEYVYRRCLQSRQADLAAILTSLDKSDDRLFELCSHKGIPVYRGALNNVLERYIEGAEKYGCEIVSRVCGDSPFVDVHLLDDMFQLIESDNLDYVAPDRRTCIAGLDSEIVTLHALKTSSMNSRNPDELEHVTQYIRNNLGQFRTAFIDASLKPPQLRDVALTVDYSGDLILSKSIVGILGNNSNFTSKDIFRILTENKHLFDLNRRWQAN